MVGLLQRSGGRRHASSTSDRTCGQCGRRLRQWPCCLKSWQAKSAQNCFHHFFLQMPLLRRLPANSAKDHAAGTHDLGKVTTRHHGGWLVVDAALEAGGAPIHELDGALGLDGCHSSIHILGHDVTASSCSQSPFRTTTRTKRMANMSIHV